MPEKMIRLLKGGQLTEIAMTSHDFFHKKSMRKGEHEFQTAADAGYTLSDRYEDLSEYDGPKSRRAYDREQEEKRAARSATRVEAKPAEKPAPKEEAKA